MNFATSKEIVYSASLHVPTDCSWPVGFLTGAVLTFSLLVKKILLCLPKIKPVYWAIPYNMCPSSKENKKSSGGGLHVMGGNVREVAIQERVQRQKIRGGGGIMRQK